MKSSDLRKILMGYSKDVLAGYIVQKCFFDRRILEDLDFMTWESMCKRARLMMDKAISDAEAYRGNRSLWMKAQADFDSAQKLYDEADKFYRRSVKTKQNEVAA